MSNPLLLDEMFSDAIAEQLRAKGHDVRAVVASPALVSLPDDQILSHAAATGRALVTANIKDFVPLDVRYRAAGQSHAGLVLVSTKSFPQDRTHASAIASALVALLDKPGPIRDSHVLFLPATERRRRAPGGLSRPPGGPGTQTDSSRPGRMLAASARAGVGAV